MTADQDDEPQDAVARLAFAVAHTPDGRVLAPLPWDSAPLLEREAMPEPLRSVTRPGWSLLRSALCLLVVGAWSQGRVGVAVFAGLTVVLVRSYLAAWRQSGNMTASGLTAPKRVAAGADVDVELKLRYLGSAPSERVIVRLVCACAAEPERYLIEPPLKPGETRRIKARFRAERGMGQFAIGPVDVIVSDGLKLFDLCVRADCAATIEVDAGAGEARETAHARANLALVPGVVEVRGSGDDGLLRGLRPFRVGDGIRRIDWKRSMRMNDLLVRDFARQEAANATILLDQNPMGHSHYRTISSFASMRETALLMARGFAAQRMPVQLLGADLQIPFGSGVGHLEGIEAVLRDLAYCSTRIMSGVLRESMLAIPPDSVVVLMVCSRGEALSELTAGLLDLEERRVEARLVVFDSDAFAREVGTRAELGESQWEAIDGLKAWLLGTPSGQLRKAAERLGEHTLVVAPGESYLEVRSLMEGTRDGHAPRSRRLG